VKKKYKILIGIGATLIVIRLILPHVVLHYANKALANMDGYYGHIEDVDISLFRGAYVINDIYLNKVDSASKEQTDFFKCANIDLSIEWSALFNGSIVGELAFDSPNLIFTKDVVEISDVAQDTSTFKKLLDGFMPLKVNRVDVNNGQLNYVDNTTDPKVDVSLNDLEVVALNLTNVTEGDSVLPATITAHATVYEGTLDFNMKLDAMADYTTFDLNAELKNTNLALLNDFFKAYGKFDVTGGQFGLYTEMATKEGKFIGYVKPFIEDLDVIGEEDRNDAVLFRLWEHVVAVAGVVLQNQKTDQVATKVEIEGAFKNPKIKKLDAVWEVLRNAFIKALLPTVDNEITINSVKKVGTDKNKNRNDKSSSSKKKWIRKKKK